MDHLEAIITLNNTVSEDFCKKIIKFSEKNCNEYLHIGTEKIYNKEIRNVLGYYLDSKKDEFIFKEIQKEIEKTCKLYEAKFPHLTLSKINQIDLLKYEEGGKFDCHVDTSTDPTRILSVIFNLNKDYEGGDLVFEDQKNNIIKQIKLQTGSVVFFPSNFMYSHGVTPVTKGTRYSIVAWLQ